MTVRYDYLGVRYDDRFVCQWHIYRDDTRFLAEQIAPMLTREAA